MEGAGAYRDLARATTVVAAVSCRLPSIVLVSILSVLLAPVAAAAGASHCSGEERTLFSCSTGSKVVSVCGSSDLSDTSGFVQYRFGRLGAPTLSYPPADSNWREVTTAGTLTFAGGGGAYLFFTNGHYRYIVYTAIGSGWGSKAGVVVEKGSRRLVSLRCKDEAASELGPDLFTQAGVPEDKGGFDVP